MEFFPELLGKCEPMVSLRSLLIFVGTMDDKDLEEDSGGNELARGLGSSGKGGKGT